MDGQGSFKWADGSKFEGQYLDDKKSGRGTYYLKNKEVIEGSWLKGKQFGQFHHTDENR